MRNPTADCRPAFSYYRRLARVRAFVEANYAEPLSLEDAAAIAGLEAKYFSAYFRKKTGVCFSQWLAAFRMEQATRRMRGCDSTITEIAFDSGFRDLRTFERAFKSQFGTTPVEYRRKIQL